MFWSFDKTVVEHSEKLNENSDLGGSSKRTYENMRSKDTSKLLTMRGNEFDRIPKLYAGMRQIR